MRADLTDQRFDLLQHTLFPGCVFYKAEGFANRKETDCDGVINDLEKLECDGN